MGQDIHGWVEISAEWTDAWWAVVKISALVERNRTFWSWMFQDRGDFPSVAPYRGIPDNVSSIVAQEIEQDKPYFNSGDCHSLTWVTWEETEAIDWDAGPRPGPLGTSREAVHQRVYTGTIVSDGVRQPTFVTEVLRTRRDTLKGYPGWELLFDVLRHLAPTHGPEYVRLVVWFDG